MSAIIVMFQRSMHDIMPLRQCSAALALVYNPVAPAFSFSGDWQRSFGGGKRRPVRRHHSLGTMRGRNRMTKLKRTAWRSALTSFLLFGVMSAATSATDLSKYRMFQLGTDLPLVAKQAGVSPSEAKVIHRRPALIQELEWRPQPLGSSSQSEVAKQVVFSFYDGELFRIAINYDRHETEGLTADDLVQAISATYGTSAKPIAPAKTVQGRYGDQEEVLARWQDLQYRFELDPFFVRA